jgi:hypothetical protein
VSGLGGIERELPPSSKQAHPHFLEIQFTIIVLNNSLPFSKLSFLILFFYPKLFPFGRLLLGYPI